ncbi:MAG: diadenylate cyclase CdaA [Bacteroidaceae bacterium]|nr:TIGR00159 family protein [Bacteroidales bacterium]MBQ2878372.1 diadenylate cyclase CdaA [Bacteroidaceae bacterium]MBQ3189057.1 diadenylate cyclase CdaA [Bacteroidaceae bacterium]MBQ3623613.1 diadenylate cyclase CdaA [Bacteroidaceae bacterium]MBR7134554.1 diadenylate cyclase CdaA [Bacteroidaceae bacterium]
MFFEISIKDIVDVVLVAFLLYYFYRLMKESGSLNIFSGILVFVLLWVFVSRVLQMKLLGSIFDQMMSVGVLAFIVIFQDEIRRFFKTLGSHRHFKKLSKFFSRDDAEENTSDYLPIVMACMSMSQQNVGALIVIERNESLEEYVQTGETVNADLSQRLIEAIFFKNAPLHDGAMIVRGGRIMAAACILPVSHDLNIPKKLGLRHRSAKGVSELTDAIAIVVSEETGNISVAVGGKIKMGLNAQQLEGILSK